MITDDHLIWISFDSGNVEPTFLNSQNSQNPQLSPNQEQLSSSEDLALNLASDLTDISLVAAASSGLLPTKNSSQRRLSSTSENETSLRPEVLCQ